MRMEERWLEQRTHDCQTVGNVHNDKHVNSKLTVNRMEGTNWTLGDPQTAYNLLRLVHTSQGSEQYILDV